ncbi:hypothetical protein [Neptunicella marina]|uniref:Uncharacterized protein n=1 Tax=Neptunicella marina TaxID=2125989 RepID=A0A8J6IXL5_9ALTE|nr:hypothetical protein [Neptunicella marina]MBC3767133.1 hypothetical protein [Neptunicella marina]
MNTTALMVGVLVAWLIIYRFNKAGYEKRQWAYSLLLATFPVYYWVFAVYAKDGSALLNEILTGVFFIATAVVACKASRVSGLLLLALGFIGHGVYDVIHLSLYRDSVAPSWWPEFCGSIDVLLGVYMLYLLHKYTPKTNTS